MKTEYQEFIDSFGGIEFPNMKYRAGATFTCNFGLVERFKKLNDKVIWGYPGLHYGVDRGRFTPKGEETFKILAPFTSSSSGFVENETTGFGSQVMLYSEFGFRFMIAHMFPKEVLIKDNLSSGYSIEKETEIGPAGTFGFSTGRHTHTEIEAWGTNGKWLEESDFLETILKERYGDIAIKTFDDETVLDRYNKIATDASEPEIGRKMLNWSKEQMIDDFKDIMKRNNISFINDYKIKRVSKTGKISTLYNSRAVFGI